ncbi:MAG: glycosyltransferase family 9 protein [Isosphaeraceae bacterium]|nr:glycosyltransferase family 9 protein [Isosphaeraceae bacterium]
MTTSLNSLEPVRVGRYRYTKWRWRIMVRALDMAGACAMALWRVARPLRPFPEPRRILLIQLDHLGDAVLTSPLLERIRAEYPDALLDVLASPSNREVFESNPNVDRVWLADRNWFERRPGRWALGSAVWKLGRSLRGQRYDLGIDVRGDVLTVFVMALAGIRRRLGWAMGGGGFLLTDVAEWVPGRHEVRSRMALLEPLSIEIDGPSRVAIHPSDAARAKVATLLREAWPEDQRASREARAGGTVRAARRTFKLKRANAGVVPSRQGTLGETWSDPDLLHAGRFGVGAPLLAVHLGAGTNAKRWPPRHWRTLVARFLHDGWRVVVVGGLEDAEAAAGLDPHENLQDWVGRLSVTETGALLERADFFIGADSGPSHLAACAGIPSVILFSGTNRPRQWRPWSRRSIVIRQDVPCRPCHQKTCPLADHPCMSKLDPDRVFRAAKRWWARLHREESPHVPI